MISNDLGLTPILIGGFEEQKREWLAPCGDEFKVFAFCLSEPSVTGPSPRLTDEILHGDGANAVTAAAARLSRKLGSPT